MGPFLLYTQILYTTLSLSLNLKKNKSQEKTFIFVDCPIIICFDTLKVYITVVKESYILCYHVVEVCSLQLFYEFVTSCFLFIFYSSYVILLRIVLLIPLKYHTGNRSCRLLQYNIITTKTYRSIFFHCLGEGSLATWWVCGQCEIWNPLPAAVCLALN